MLILGVNETAHDAALALIQDNKILFAGHAERYSKTKNDWYVNDGLLRDALSYGTPDLVAYYEKPLLKASRVLTRGGLGDWRPRLKLDGVPVKRFLHHYSHAAAGYFTSPFDNAVVVVLDAIGEWDTCTVWHAVGDKIELVYKKRYPFSFGLFYSAFTKLIGLKPNEEEYILMGMAAYGDPSRYYKRVSQYFGSMQKQSYNFHYGIRDWTTPESMQVKFDIAAAVQLVYDERLVEFMLKARQMTSSRNLVFMGGCALNCSANTPVRALFDDMWIMPNPGDAGSSLGAAAAAFGAHLDWRGPYLGHDLGGEYPTEQIIERLLDDGVVAVASGRAEYGPRALGNRSILADPRHEVIKDRVNRIKKRELFRPFAPVVMEEHAADWFDMDFASPYMQYAVRCRRADEIPAVVHEDGTSRVQTVNRSQHSGLYDTLDRWYQLTGVPVLLNTSLNIKGQPLLNDLDDVEAWQRRYKTTIVGHGAS